MNYDDFNDGSNQFTLSCVLCDGSETIVSFSATYLPDVFEKFEQFIKGCGYSLPEGTHIDTVEID